MHIVNCTAKKESQRCAQTDLGMWFSPTIDAFQPETTLVPSVPFIESLNEILKKMRMVFLDQFNIRHYQAKRQIN